MMRETWQHQFKGTRAFPTYAPGAVAHVVAGLHHLQGNARPYFSVTGDVVTPESRKRGDIDTGGCIHDIILKLWPKLAPVIALHLCDDTGAPSHDGGNAWYYLAGYFPDTGDRYISATSKYHFPRVVIDPARPWDTTEYRYPTPEECLEQFADYVRIPLEEARAVALHIYSWSDDWTRARAALARWLDTQRPRWQREAAAAVALLDTLNAEKVTS